MAHRTSQFIELTATPLHSHRYIHPQTGTPSSCLPTPLSISGYLKNLPKDLCAALGHCYFPPNTSELVAELHNQSLFIASNGSVCNIGATHAWILYGAQTKSVCMDMVLYLGVGNFSHHSRLKWVALWVGYLHSMQFSPQRVSPSQPIAVLAPSLIIWPLSAAFKLGTIKALVAL